MSATGGGTVLNVSSTIAFRKSPRWAVYSASKAYLLSLTRSLEMEFRYSSIRITVLCPGKTVSEFDRNAGFPDVDNSKKDSPDFVVQYALKKLCKGKTLIIPGWKNKGKYMIFKYLPDYLTDWLIASK